MPNNAASVILFHCHSSCEPEPSNVNINLQRRSLRPMRSL
ncbi:JAB domain-containing protein [Dehalobacter restrictus]